MGPDLRLPCGVARSAVVADAVAEGSADGLAHGSGCRHCTEVRDDVRRRWEAVRDGLAWPVRPDRSVARAVFRRIGDRRAGDELPLRSSGPGRTVVARVLLEEIAARVGAEVTGVASVPRATLVAAAGDGAHLLLEIEAAVTWEHPLAPVAAAVRRAVTVHLPPLVGMAVDRVDILVVEARISG